MAQYGQIIRTANWNEAKDLGEKKFKFVGADTTDNGVTFYYFQKYYP